MPRWNLARHVQLRNEKKALDESSQTVYDESEAEQPDTQGEQMTILNFTDEHYPKSTAVDEAFYNENTKTLFVDLHNSIYAYSGVEKSVWEQFKDSDSAGSFYATVVKRNYGPAREIGSASAVYYQKVDVQERATAAVGSPQDLKPASSAPAAPTYYNLNVQVNTPTGNATSRFVVKFSVGSDRTEKSHEVSAPDEAAALKLFNDLASVFTTETLKIRSVTHYFE